MESIRSGNPAVESHGRPPVEPGRAAGSRKYLLSAGLVGGMGDPVLEVENLIKEFGGLTAVSEVTATFHDDELVAVIGPNGAGKTTFFNLLTGVLTPTAGTIQFDGDDITDLGAAAIARRGLIRSYQITQLFDELTVLENVRIAAQTDANPYEFWRPIDDHPELTDRAERVLDRVGLSDKRDEPAATLSHGEQRTLEIAVSLGTDPTMLLLDEPSSGMSPEETTDVIELLGELAADFPLMLVEHKMAVVWEVADRIIVLHKGEKIADGSPADVRTDDRVRRVYLGEEEI